MFTNRCFFINKNKTETESIALFSIVNLLVHVNTECNSSKNH